MKTQNIFFTLVLFVSGCAPSIPNIELSNSQKQNIVVSRIVVNDLTGAPDYSIYNRVWSSDYNPLPDKAVNPPFRTISVQQVRNSFAATGTGSEELTISILSAVILEQSRIIDSVGFVGIAASYAPRGFRCSIDANFQYAGRSSRKSFQHDGELSFIWADPSPPDSPNLKNKTNFVNQCLSNITMKIESYIQEVVIKQ